MQPPDKTHIPAYAAGYGGNSGRSERFNPLARIDFATSDADLQNRLKQSEWLRGRRYSMPDWLGTNDLGGDPCQIPFWRLDYLSEHPKELPSSAHERRYRRNKAAVMEIATKFAEERSLRATAPVFVPKKSHPANGVGTVSRPVIIDGATAAHSSTSMVPMSAAHSSTSTVPMPTAESLQKEADRLKRTVLAPFYERMEADSNEIIRLRAEIQQMARVSDSETRGTKRKASPTSPMRMGDAANGDNDYTTEGHLIYLANKIVKDLGETVANETIHLCGLAPLHIIKERPDEVLALAHQKLNTWPYQNVPTCWRRLYEDASLLKVVQLLYEQADVIATTEKIPKRRKLVEGAPSEVRQQDWLSEIIKTFDMGHMLSGAPGRAAVFDSLHQQLANYVEDQEIKDMPSRWNVVRPKSLETNWEITRADHPVNFEAFQRYMDRSTTPMIIPGTMKQWPASERWKNPAYLLGLTLGGRRLVPVELGKSYTDDDWSQTIMPFGEFVKKYLLPTELDEVGYLAQHDLFAQIPALEQDIMNPDYCYTTPPDADAAASRTAGLTSVAQLDAPLRNAWLGPKGTKTPLHTDPYHNILCQVVGYKYVRLYSPEETPKLYPHGVDDKGISMDNTSQVDVSLSRQQITPKANKVLALQDIDRRLDTIRESEEKFPLFKQAKYVEGILAPGECLYIPLGWWHYVESLSTSFSVSFWWN